MVRNAFLFFNTLSMIIFLLATFVILSETFPLKEIEYEDNILMLIYAACVFLLVLTSAANFHHFFRSLKPSGYLFIVPLTCALLSVGFAAIALLAGSVDIFWGLIASAISMVPLANVFLLKKLNFAQHEQVDVSVFN